MLILQQLQHIPIHSYHHTAALSSGASRRSSHSLGTTTLGTSPPRIITGHSEISGISTAVAQPNTWLDVGIASSAGCALLYSPSSSSYQQNHARPERAAVQHTGELSSGPSRRSISSASSSSSLTTESYSYSGIKQTCKGLHPGYYDTNSSPRRTSPSRSGVVPPYNTPTLRHNHHNSSINGVAALLRSPINSTATDIPQNAELQNLVSPMRRTEISLDLHSVKSQGYDIVKSVTHSGPRSPVRQLPSLSNNIRSNGVNSVTALADGVRRQLVAWRLSTTGTTSLLQEFMNNVSGSGGSSGQSTPHLDTATSIWLCDRDSRHIKGNSNQTGASADEKVSV